MINKVILVGRLVRDPELKTSTTGTNFCTFRMAVDNRKGADGKVTATFVSCVGFGQTSDTIIKYARKGMLIGVDGRLSQRSFVTNDDKKVSFLEVVVDSFQFMEKKSSKNDDVEIGQFELNPEFSDADLPY